MAARVHSLGYLVVETTDLDRWRELAVDVLGMAVSHGPDPDALYLRIDDRPYRLVIHPGQTERLVTVGWEVRDRETWREVVAQLEAAGAPVKPASPELLEERRVQELVLTEDPAGTHMGQHDLSRLRLLFLAGERCDPDTLNWARERRNRPDA